MPTAVKTRGSVSSVTQFLTTSKESSPAEAEKQSTTATTSQGSCASINKGHFQAFILSDLKAEILCTLHSIRRKHFRVPYKYWSQVLSHMVLETLGNQPGFILQCPEYEIVSLTTEKL